MDENRASFDIGFHTALSATEPEKQVETEGGRALARIASAIEMQTLKDELQVVKDMLAHTSNQLAAVVRTLDKSSNGQFSEDMAKVLEEDNAGDVLLVPLEEFPTPPIEPDSIVVDSEFQLEEVTGHTPRHSRESAQEILNKYSRRPRTGDSEKA